MISESWYYAPSGKSPHMRSQYNFLGMVQASDLLRQKYKDRIDPELGAAIAQQRGVVLHVHQANVARAYRRSKQYSKYVRYVAAKPSLIASLFSRTLHRAPKLLRRGG